MANGAGGERGVPFEMQEPGSKAEGRPRASGVHSSRLIAPTLGLTQTGTLILGFVPPTPGPSRSLMEAPVGGAGSEAP